MSDESFFPKSDWLNSFRLRTAYGANGVQPGATAGAPDLLGGDDESDEGRHHHGIGPAGSRREPAREREPQAGKVVRARDRVRDRPAQPPPPPRLHVLQQEDDERVDQRADRRRPSASPVTSLLQNIGSTQQLGTRVPGECAAGRPAVVRLGRHVQRVAQQQQVARARHRSDDGNAERIIGAGLTHAAAPGLSAEFAVVQGLHVQRHERRRHVIQRSEVQVDTGRFSTGYNFPRDIISIQNGIDLFQRRVRITALFDYRGGGNTSDGTNYFQCTSAPQGVPENRIRRRRSGCRRAPSRRRSARRSTARRSKHDARLLRERSVLEVPRVLGRPLSCRPRLLHMVRGAPGSTLVFGARNLHTWTNFTGVDPEENYGVNGSEGQNEFNTAPRRRTSRSVST